MQIDNVPPIPPKPKHFPRFAIASICFGAGYITLLLFQWVLIDFFTPFLIGPLLWCLPPVLVLLIIASVVYFLLKRENPTRAVAPLLINVVTALIVFYVPFTDIWLTIEFRMNFAGYNEVVKLAEEGHLQPNDIGLAELPQEYQHLSRGGEVIIDTSDGTPSVFFFTFRGMGNYSGYMYRADDTPPTRGWSQVERQRLHWYFCASS